MSDKENYICNFLEELPVEVKEVLDSLEIAVTNEVSSEAEPLFCFVSKNPSPDVTNSVSFVAHKRVCDFFRNGGMAIIDPQLANHPDGIETLKKFFSSTIVSKQDTELDDVTSNKITSVAGVGCYSDIIYSKSTETISENNSVRFFTFSLLNTLVLMEQVKLFSFPIDFDYATSNTKFEARFSLDVPSNNVDKVIFELLGVIERESIHSSHIVDIKFVNNRRLTLTLGWVKGIKVDYPTVLLGRSVKFADKKWNSECLPVNINKLESGGPQSEEVIRASVLKSLISTRYTSLVENPLRIKRIVMYLHYICENSVPEILKEEVALKDLSFHLKDFPNQDLVQGLNDNDKELILKLLHNSEMFEAFLEQYESFLEEELENEDVSVSLVKATMMEMNSNMLGCSSINNKEDDKIVLKNMTDHMTDEVWKVKRLAVLKKIDGKEKVSRDELTEILGGELGIESDIIQVVSNSIQENAADTIVGGKFAEALDEVFTVKGEGLIIENEHQLIQKQTYHIDKMRSIIQKMKTELLARSEADKSLERSDKDSEIIELTRKLTNKEAELKRMEQVRFEDLESMTATIESLKAELDAKEGITTESIEVVSDGTVSKELEIAKQQIAELQEKLSAKDDGGDEREELRAKTVTLQSNLKEVKDELKIEVRKSKELENKLISATSGSSAEMDRKVAAAIKRTEAKFEHKMKQLNLMNDKLSNSSRKAEQDLISKKQELVKLKSDKQALENQLTILERKVKANKAA